MLHRGEQQGHEMKYKYRDVINQNKIANIEHNLPLHRPLTSVSPGGQDLGVYCEATKKKKALFSYNTSCLYFQNCLVF